MKIELKTLAGSVLFEGDFSCLSDAVTAAVKGGVRLAGANLAGANLAGANLARANLAGANLARANLARAYLARAYLARANLAGANLARAYLAGANLDGANLAGANLDGACHHFAQVAFSGHGECGRMLSAVILKKGEAPRLFCGCFTGDVDELRAFIAKGDTRLRKTRTLALDTVMALLAAENDPKTDG